MSEIMKTSKIDPNKSAEDNGEERAKGRRRQDAVISNNPDQLLNLDRRASNSDRRVDSNPNYKGPARRNIIDRRLNLKDRRNQGLII